MQDLVCTLVLHLSFLAARLCYKARSRSLRGHNLVPHTIEAMILSMKGRRRPLLQSGDGTVVVSG